MPLKLTIACVYFYSTETRKIVIENIIFLSCNIMAYYHNKLTINCTITLSVIGVGVRLAVCLKGAKIEKSPF